MNTAKMYAELISILNNRVHRTNEDIIRAAYLADQLGEMETRDDLQELARDIDI